MSIPTPYRSPCNCGRFSDEHERQRLCDIGFNEFLGEVQHRLIQAGYNPPVWPEPSIRDQGDLDAALDSCVKWCRDRLDAQTLYVPLPSRDDVIEECVKVIDRKGQALTNEYCHGDAGPDGYTWTNKEAEWQVILLGELADEFRALKGTQDSPMPTK